MVFYVGLCWSCCRDVGGLAFSSEASFGNPGAVGGGVTIFNYLEPRRFLIFNVVRRSIRNIFKGK